MIENVALQRALSYLLKNYDFYPFTGIFMLKVHNALFHARAQLQKITVLPESPK